GYVKPYTVTPSAIYSIARAPLAAAGMSRAHNRLWDLLILILLERGQGGMVEGGKIYGLMFISTNVRKLEIIQLQVCTPPKNSTMLSHGRVGIFFAHSDEYDVHKGVGEVMSRFGKGKTPDPTPFSEEEL
ncbi:hypothetical protein L218DRAFT_813292, partial [Marasmius fiardii PR-910]